MTIHGGGRPDGSLSYSHLTPAHKSRDPGMLNLSWGYPYSIQPFVGHGLPLGQLYQATVGYHGPLDAEHEMDCPNEEGTCSLPFCYTYILRYTIASVWLRRPCGRLQLHLMSRNPAQPRLPVLLNILFFFHRASWLPRRTYLGFNSFLLTPIKGRSISGLFVKIRRDDLTFQVGSELYIASNTQPKVSPGLQI